MARPSRVVIDRNALKHNFSRVKQLAPNSKVMAVIKADAYGHGIERVAKTLDEADAFGVAMLDEARQLREAGIKQRIVLLEGPHRADELTDIQSLNLEPVIHHQSQLDMLESNNNLNDLQVWLKFDTGMHRLGFLPEEFESVWQRIQNCGAVNNTPRLMTHLATANEAEHPLTQKQLDCFESITQELNLEKTIANSAATLTLNNTHVDWVRPGLMLYGVSPLLNADANEHNLKPVMTLESALIAVKNLKAGESVGYGAKWSCPEDMQIGIVAAGYGDGFPRHAKTGTPILVNEQRCELIGRASMDMLCVDLRKVNNAQVGDTVTLWGKGLPIEEVAASADTIPYELLCGVHKRLEFVEVV